MPPKAKYSAFPIKTATPLVVIRYTETCIEDYIKVLKSTEALQRGAHAQALASRRGEI